MNRNTESHFSEAPQVNIQRSRFERSCNIKTSFNVGELIPFFIDEVLPGDTFEVKTSKVFRMQTLKTPIMDNLWVDTYYFYVPNRIVWEHWQNFLGENSDSAWIPQNVYTVPTVSAPSGGWNVGTIADYLGIPPGVSNIEVNALPFRGYAMICDQFFRDENVSDPLVINTGDSTLSGSNGGSYVQDVAAGGKPFVAAKMHDYFTSCLPSPQKGPDVQLPFAAGATLPVFADSGINSHFLDPTITDADDAISKFYETLADSHPVMYGNNDTPHNGSTIYPWFLRTDGKAKGSLASPSYPYRIDLYNVGSSSFSTPLNTVAYFDSDDNAVGITGINIDDFEDKTNNEIYTPMNLVADGNVLSAYTSINQIREAFQIQRFFEKNARGGSRYRELIATHFQTQIGDVRSMIPEYLGGNRLPLNVQQITQTSSNVEGQPLGDVAGMSVTNDNHFDFVKSFTEHGYIIGLMVARYKHTYQQGIEPTFLRRTKFNYYWPVFAHIGEQAVKNATLFAQGTDADDEVFGYQEAWADYRYKFDRVSGMMRSVSASGLDTWHFADNYASLPTLSDSWIREDKSNVDRTLSVTSNVSNQIFADVLVTNYTTRPMPLYSIPGLVDHF